MHAFRRTLLLAMATALVALVLPAIASANDYCVDATCPGTDVDSIEDAFGLAAKSPDADRVFLGDEIYYAKSSSGFVYGGSGPIELVGAGQGRTRLMAAGASGDVLSLHGGPGSSVHDLSIFLPELATGYGLYTGNDARRIDVSEEPGKTQANPRGGVLLSSGATLEDSDVTLAREPDTTAVAFGPAAAPCGARSPARARACSASMATARSTARTCRARRMASGRTAG